MTNSSSSRVFFILLLASSFLGLGLLCDRLPLMIENYLKKNVDLATNEMIRSFWSKPPIIFPTYFWVFNITNPAAFLRGENAMVQKVGPFYVTSVMEKRIIDISKNNYRISYNSTRIYSMNESTVGANLDKPIWALNVILPSIFNALTEKTRNMDEQQAQMMSATAFKMAEKFNESLLIQTTPREVLFGRKSMFLKKAMKLAQAFSDEAAPIAGLNDDGLFGFIANQNATLSGPYETYTGFGETSDSLGNIISIQGKQRSAVFMGTCGKIQVSAGELRPFPIGFNQTLEMYRGELGRVIHLKPTGVHKLKEGLGISYVLSDLDFMAPFGDPKRDCYCVNGSLGNYCSLNGAIELGPVQNFAPIIFTTDIIEPDERIRNSIGNYSPDLLNSHVDSIPDGDKTCQFLILRNLGIPIKADFTAALFIKTIRNSKIQSMSNIPEVSYLPVMMQRERIEVPETFLAPLGHVNTLIELAKHMRVVFYVSALFLIVPLTNLYYRQSSVPSNIQNHLSGNQNNNNQGGSGEDPNSDSNGNSLGADVRRSSTFAGLQVSGGKSMAENQPSVFVVPVNIGNLTPESKSSGARLPFPRDKSGSINQVGCSTNNSIDRTDNGKASHDSNGLNTTGQQQARYFSKLNQTRNKIGSEQARGSISSINSKLQTTSGQPLSIHEKYNNNLSGKTQNSHMAIGSKGDLNTKRLSLTNQTLPRSDSQSAADNNDNVIMTGLKPSLIGGDPPGDQFVKAAPVDKSTVSGGVSLLKQRGSNATILDLEPGAGPEQLEPNDGQETVLQPPARQHRNWFVKVYADVVRVLNDIKRTISTASQLDISETSDVHDKQLELLADRIDNWYGGVSSSDKADKEQSATLIDNNRSNLGDPVGLAATAVDQTTPHNQTSQSIHAGTSGTSRTEKQQAIVTSKMTANNATRNLVKREAPIAEESDANRELADGRESGVEAGSGSIMGNQQKTNVVDNETQTSGNVDNEELLEQIDQKVADGRELTGSMAGAGTGSESPVKSLEESAMGLSVDIESTNEVDAIDKAVALQKLEQTIEKLEVDDQLTGDLVDLNSMQDTTSEKADSGSSNTVRTEQQKGFTVDEADTVAEVRTKNAKLVQDEDEPVEGAGNGKEGEDDASIQQESKQKSSRQEVSTPNDRQQLYDPNGDADGDAEGDADANANASAATDHCGTDYVAVQSHEIESIDSKTNGREGLNSDSNHVPCDDSHGESNIDRNSTIDAGVVSNPHVDVYAATGGADGDVDVDVDVYGDQINATTNVQSGIVTCQAGATDSEKDFSDRTSSQGQLTAASRAPGTQNQTQANENNNYSPSNYKGQDKPEVTTMDNKQQQPPILESEPDPELNANGDENGDQTKNRIRKQLEQEAEVLIDSAFNDRLMLNDGRFQAQVNRQGKQQHAARNSAQALALPELDTQHSVPNHSSEIHGKHFNSDACARFRRPTSDRATRRRQHPIREETFEQTQLYDYDQHYVYSPGHADTTGSNIANKTIRNEIMAVKSLGTITQRRLEAMADFPVDSQLGITKSGHGDKFTAMRRQAAQAS